MESIRYIKKNLVVNNNQLYSGLASLLSIVRYHGAYSSLEEVRVLSGTNESGSTLFGLRNAANTLGFVAKGFKLDIETLKESKSPIILSIISKITEQQGYGILFGLIQINGQEKFVWGDPLKGVSFLTQKQIEEIWSNNICLTVEPTAQLVKTADYNDTVSIINYLRTNPKLLSVIILFDVVCAIISIFPATYFISQLFDFWIKSDCFFTIVASSGVLLLLFVIKEALTHYKERLSTLFAMSVEKETNETFHDRFKKLPNFFFDS